MILSISISVYKKMGSEIFPVCFCAILYQECVTIKDLCKKWNTFCSSVHKYPEKPLNNIIFSSPPSSNSFSSCIGAKHLSPSSPKEYQFWVLENDDGHHHDQEDGYESDVKMFIPDAITELPPISAAKPELLSNPNSSPNSASSSEVMEDTENLHSFKKLNPENMKILCDELEKEVEWQRDIVADIVTTILQCRSRMRPGKLGNQREDSWLFFLGDDSRGKDVVARTLAKLIFGSQNNVVSIGLSSFDYSSSELESKKKRSRNEMGCSYLQRFGEAVNENPHRVFFMEDVEQVDYYSQKGIKQAIENGRVRVSGDGGDDETVPLKDAIVIFSCESFSSVSRASSPKIRDNDGDEHYDGEAEKSLPCMSLDLNIAIEDNNVKGGDDCNDIGLLESVDKKILFKINENCSVREI